MADGKKKTKTKTKTTTTTKTKTAPLHGKTNAPGQMKKQTGVKGSAKALAEKRRTAEKNRRAGGMTSTTIGPIRIPTSVRNAPLPGQITGDIFTTNIPTGEVPKRIPTTPTTPPPKKKKK